LDDSYEPDYTGKGVHVYVLDTAVRFTHTEFAGKDAACFYNVFTKNNICDSAGNHGSHVAATVVGTTYGVAKGATLLSVQVLDSQGKGPMSGVIEGIDQIIKEKERNPSVPMVANLSLGGDFSDALDAAVDRAVRSGIVFVVSAGNEMRRACSQSPAAADKAITVAASTKRDKFARYSNWGSCVDILA
jgi:subtilisin family serine protease